MKSVKQIMFFRPHLLIVMYSFTINPE